MPRWSHVVTPMKVSVNSTAHLIIAGVCNKHRNSDLRADDPDVIRALDERFEALEKIARDWEVAALAWRKNFEKLDAGIQEAVTGEKKA